MSSFREKKCRMKQKNSRVKKIYNVIVYIERSENKRKKKK